MSDLLKTIKNIDINVKKESLAASTQQKLDTSVVSLIADNEHYKQLNKFLKDQKWQKADLETFRLMLKLTHREKDGWLDKDSIINFPCQDLRIIDQLWLKYSQGRFGFSIQTKLWIECGGKLNQDDYDPSDYDIFCAYGRRNGWLVNNSWINYDHIQFSIDAMPAHLPILWGKHRVRGYVGLAWQTVMGKYFYSHIYNCQL